MIAALLNIPKTPEEWLRWGWHHAEHHQEIQQAIAKQGVNLTIYVLYPLPEEDVGGWLLRHQQTHLDMDGALGLQSVDLQGVDLKDERQLQAWIWSNYLEHQAAGAKLRI